MTRSKTGTVPERHQDLVEDACGEGAAHTLFQSLFTNQTWNDLSREMDRGSPAACWLRLDEWDPPGVWTKLDAVLPARRRHADRTERSRVAVDAMSSVSDASPPVSTGATFTS